MRVKDKVILVTGGGDGIGRELVLNLLLKGATVIAVDIHETALHETRERAGHLQNRLITLVTDISDKTAVEALSGQVMSITGVVDGVINNAGIIQPFVPFHRLSYDDLERVMKVNFYGTVHILKTFLPHLLTRPEAHIVNISSMGGFVPVPGQSVYGASKAAVKLLTESLHAELASTKVGVTVVFPGAVNTHISENSGLPKPPPDAPPAPEIKMTSAEKAAKQIVAGIEKNCYRVLIGSDSRTMDWMYRLHPAYAARLIYSRLKHLLST